MERAAGSGAKLRTSKQLTTLTGASSNRHQSKGQHLLPCVIFVRKAYNEDVRYYTTKQLNGGVTFKCVFCEHTVITLGFDHTKGNRRTQAATAMNQHARELHFSQMRTSAPLKSGSCGAL